MNKDTTMTHLKPFEHLTYQGQVRRLRKLAQLALVAYGLENVTFRLIFHGENTTFRVDAPDIPASTDLPSAYAPRRFLLRVHRPGYQNQAAIASELLWLTALREADLIVPEPLSTQEGALFVETSAPGVPTARVCSLLRWIQGRFINKPRPQHFVALGHLMAQLHEHVMQWQPPSDFTRRDWNWDGLFGDKSGFNLLSNAVWALLPDPYRAPFQSVADQMRQLMTDLSKGPDVFGLIHSDLHLGNVLFAKGYARPIDFDDCGYGYWAYNFAAALGEYANDDSWLAYRNALFQGYAEVRPVPNSMEAHLMQFIAARQVSLALWATDMAQVNPRFAKDLAGWYTWIAETIARCETES